MHIRRESVKSGESFVGTCSNEMQEMADMETQKPNMDTHDIFKTANNPVTLKFEDVVYKVKTKKGDDQNSQEKVILKGVTGIVKPGEMLAMLGPSGSGKTTLLTALGGRLGGKLNGTISYSGKPFSSMMKRKIGFVTQDDVLYQHLTVTETLVFTALLRLPNILTKGEKIMHAESVLTQLGLTKCKNNIIGGSMLRGISGGERKRVSIGQEMLINPSLLFLDEPTSGLDSTTAQRIVSTLWELANGGRTIAMTIHQPSSRLFYMFHKVLLLSDGYPIYFGKGSEAMEYFESIGYVPSFAMNPSDFLLDLANGIPSGELFGDQAMVKKKLVSEYNTKLSDKVKSELHEVSDMNEIEDEFLNQQADIERWATTWWQQFTALLSRGLKERKHESFSCLNLGQVIVVSFIIGLLWWKSNLARLQDQVGLLFFISGFWGFFPLYHAISTFPEERLMLQKERSSGMYRLSSYFLSRTVSDLPMDLVLPTAFLSIIYWMTGLKPSAGNFFFTLSVIMLTVLVVQGLGLALGAVVMNQKTATTLGSVLMMSFSLCGGFYIRYVPPFIAWIKYLSPIRFSYKLVMGSQYNGDDTYPCDNSAGYCWVAENQTIKQVGLDGQAMSGLALLLMLVVYRVIAYLALMRVGVTGK